MDTTYSIFDHFSGGSVLLTGSTGYVGALVLERLLRSTNVHKIFIMMRNKKGEDIQARLQKMLNSSPVMHLLRGNVVLEKVYPIAGDMTATGLGISMSDRQQLQAEVDTVIHCAADIRLENGIKDLLLANYEGTRQLLDMSRSFDNLKAFVHVSSAYTNMNAEPGSLVQESIYRLLYGDQLVDDHELVQELLSMPAHNANLRAEGMLAQWNFPNNYTLSKHLAEYMVADYQKQFNMPVAIVRPTLISSVARDPYPGYTGNYAGHVGATLAFMAGLFDCPAASNYKASNVWDVIPADVCVNVILAAAAALGHGVAGACASAPLYKGPAALLQQLQGCAGKAGQRDVGQRRDQGQGSVGQEQVLIVHCGSSTTYPLTIMESWNWGVEVYGAWPMVPNLVWGKCAGPLYSSHEPNPTRAAYHIWLTGLKIWLAAKLLTWMKMEKVARKLTVGFESFKVINQPKTDVNLRFSTNNMQRMAALLDPAEQDEFLLLWKPQITRNSSSAGVTHTAEAAAAMSALDSKAKMALCGPLPKDTIATAAQPVERRTSTASHDTSTYSDTESSIDAECSSDSKAKMALCGPLPKDTIATAAQPVERRTSTASHDTSTYSDTESSIDAECSSVTSTVTAAEHHGAVLTPEQEEEVRKMRNIPIEWRSFHISLGAFLYCNLFQMPVPPNVMRITKPEVSRWLNIKPQDQVIHHHFKLYK